MAAANDEDAIPPLDEILAALDEQERRDAAISTQLREEADLAVEDHHHQDQQQSPVQRECQALGPQCSWKGTQSRKQPAGTLLERRKYAESRGIPVHLLKDATINLLLWKLQEHEKMTSKQLDDWLKSTGFPRSPETKDKDMRHLLKQMTIWFELPKEELQRLCIARSLPTDDDAVAGLENGLVDLLFIDEHRALWEAQGWKARQAASMDQVAGTVLQYNSFAQSSKADLLSAFESVSLPADSNLDEGALLRILKSIMVWEYLPVAELEAECRARDISLEEVRIGVDGNVTPDAVEERRSRLRFLLTLELCAPSYESLGVPVRQLGLHGAATVVGHLDRLKGMSVEELQTTYGEYGMPTTASMPDAEELRCRLRDVTIWLGLPIGELWGECETHGMEMRGFNRASSELEEGVLRRLLIDRLLLQSCVLRTAAPPASSSTADGAGSLPLRPIAHHFVNLMRDPIVAHRICGVVKPRQPVNETLPACSAYWTEEEVAAYCVSGGVFDPDKHRRAPVGSTRARTLVSVTVPTTDKRQHFHALLYKCFNEQEYENKELIVVDTGKQPSDFFEELQRTDDRVIYRHFKVEDSRESQDARPIDKAWTLGLKRNIACCLAQGAAIAHFDDDDMYAPGYLGFMWQKLLQAVGCDPNNDDVPEMLPPAAVKLSDWHLLDIHDMTFRYLDVLDDMAAPVHESRGWLFGWGFSYFFTKTAWQLVPVPDIEFAEDAGFIEGLLARGIPVELARLPDVHVGLCAHSFHPGSTSGGERDARAGRCGIRIDMPHSYANLLPTMRAVQASLSRAQAYPRIPAEIPRHAPGRAGGRLGQHFQTQQRMRANATRSQPQQVKFEKCRLPWNQRMNDID